jgi:hypothetical protein
MTAIISIKANQIKQNTMSRILNQHQDDDTRTRIQMLIRKYKIAYEMRNYEVANNCFADVYTYACNPCV